MLDSPYGMLHAHTLWLSGVSDEGQPCYVMCDVIWDELLFRFVNTPTVIVSYQTTTSKAWFATQHHSRCLLHVCVCPITENVLMLFT